MKEVTRLRTMVAAPIGVVLYIHAFYVPGGPDSSLYSWISWLGAIPIQQLFFLEILLLIINFGSIVFSNTTKDIQIKRLCLVFNFELGMTFFWTYQFIPKWCDTIFIYA